jgi:hypothetical protein
VAQDPAAPQPAPEPAPENDEALVPLLKALGEKAAVYESIALRFTCVETARDSEKPLNEKRYDYMYVEEEAQRYRPYRQKHSEKAGATPPETVVETDFPDSYSWTLMFAPARQHLFHFKIVGEEWFSLRRATVLSFVSPLPYSTGKTIYEWDGKVWVDAENYNFLKVEAVPSNQEARLKQLLAQYRQAPRFLVFPMGHRPIGARYEITFLNDYQKLSLPDQAEFRQFTLDLEGTVELTAFQVQRYGNYQFFGVQLQDRFLK